MILRRHISCRLAEYYAQPSGRVVGSVSSAFPSASTASNSPDNIAAPIDFSNLLGGWHYRRLFARLYNEQQGQWLTPVELFRPYYSNILGEFVVHAVSHSDEKKNVDEEENRDEKKNIDEKEHRDIWVANTANSIEEKREEQQDIHIVELGGGRGTNAAQLLSHLRSAHPAIYERTKYTIYDASPTLQSLQRKIVSEAGHDKHKCAFVLKDMIDVAEGREPLVEKSEVPTIVIALELLDNLGHDKVWCCRKTRAFLQAEVIEEDVSSEKDDTDGEIGGRRDARHKEVFEPLSDPLLKNLLRDFPSYASNIGRRPQWIPTVACGVIQHLFDRRPNLSLVLADFDWLPPPELVEGQSMIKRNSVLADGDPIVTDMNDVDHADYTAATSSNPCDILYPTDFDRLADYVRSCASKGRGTGMGAVDVEVASMKQADFLHKYSKEEVDQTRSWVTGFTPLMDDFSNYSVVAAISRNNMGQEEEIASDAIRIKN